MNKKHRFFKGTYCTAFGNGYTESVIHIILEHYDTEEYRNVLFIIWPPIEWHEEGMHYKEIAGGHLFIDCIKMKEFYDKIIFYDLEHTYIGCMPWIDDEWLRDVDEIWTPWLENLSCYGPYSGKARFMPLRYTKFLENFHIETKKDHFYDGAFFGTITPYRSKLLTPLIANPRRDDDPRGYYIIGLNQYQVPEALADTGFIIDLTQAWRKYLCTQNVVRVYEAICIGKTVVSDKSIFNYYPDAVIEVEDPFADLIYTIKNSDPSDYSSAFRDLTYEDSSFEIYKSGLEHRFNQGGNAGRSRVPNPKFDSYKPI